VQVAAPMQLKKYGTVVMAFSVPTISLAAWQVGVVQ
jgi:hypothetical protein